jgi:hypothetical protein
VRQHNAFASGFATWRSGFDHVDNLNLRLVLQREWQ